MKKQILLGTDRRQTRRFPAKASAFAVLSGNPVRIGQILDLSCMGLAFTYLSDIDWPHPPLSAEDFLTLHCEGRHIRLQPNQYRIVTDRPFAPTFSLSHIPMRRISFSLCHLSPEEKNLLKEYRRP